MALAAYDYERCERAREVQEHYHIEDAGARAYVVMHPDEPERCYLVDMIFHSCTCPDWCCRNDQIGACKHLIAIERIQAGSKKPFLYRGRPTADCGFVAVPDLGPDPFQKI